MNYRRICEGISDKGILIPSNEVRLFKSTKPLYYSIFNYSEKHKEQFDQTGTIAGITDVSTNIIYFDFDSSANLDDAIKDAKSCVQKLLELKLDPRSIRVFFSGKKGAGVEIHTLDNFTVDQVKNITANLAGEYATFDKQIYNASRLIRMPLSRHLDTGNYKTPFAAEEFLTLETTEIVKQSKNVDDIDVNALSDYWTKISFPKELIVEKKDVVKELTKNHSNISGVDFTKKPDFLTPEKYILSLGHFEPGERNHALMILGATYHYLKFDKQDAYRLLKSAVEKQCERTGQDKFPKEEIWNNIIATVYGPTWKGRTYSVENDYLLARIQAQLPEHIKIERRVELVSNENIMDKFIKFSIDIDKNTIKTGIKALDKKLMLITGTSVGILGAPGSGKSTLVMNLLSTTSLANEVGIFYSLDMNESLIALKQIQRISGLSNGVIFDMVKQDRNKFLEMKGLADKEFQNVAYSFKSGVTVDGIRNDVIRYQERTGKKVRLVVVDYLESIQSGINDPTVGSGLAAQGLTNIASELDLLMVILLQTQKSVHPGDAITSMRSIKGASVIEQALSVAIGIHREGQPVQYQNWDKTLTVNVVKNRFGMLSTTDVEWIGARSIVTDLTDESRRVLNELKDLKKDDVEKDKKKWEDF